MVSTGPAIPGRDLRDFPKMAGAMTIQMAERITNAILTDSEHHTEGVRRGFGESVTKVSPPATARTASGRDGGAMGLRAIRLRENRAKWGEASTALP